MELILIVVVIVVAGVLLLTPWVIRTYNMLVHGKNRVNEVWSNIEVQLNRRHELVPNIVSTVKGYAKHEEGTFTKVTEARASAMSAKSRTELAQSENMLMAGLSSLFAVAEGYPELRASANFMNLQEELSQIENTIQQARTQYNGAVRKFNTAIETFPRNLIAGMLGFKKFDFYDAPDAANQAPKTFSE